MTEMYPSPAETLEYTIQTLNNETSSRNCISVQEFKEFTTSTEQLYQITKKGDIGTNIIDQYNKITYNFDDITITKLFTHLNAMRKDKINCHFSERQGTTTQPNTGLMFDYDMYVTNATTQIDERQLYRISSQIVKYLYNDIEFTTGSVDVTIKVFNIVKEKPLFIEKNKYKYGIHVLIPEIQVSREYKKYLLRKIREDPSICNVFKSLGTINDPKEILDMNSASVPVLFLGSCKRGGQAYILSHSFEITFDPSDYDYSPMVKAINIRDLESKNYNMVAELSLCYEAKYLDKRPYVTKKSYEYKDSIKTSVIDVAARTTNNVISESEIMLTEHELSTLALHDPKARYFHQLLDLLDESYYTERNKWRNVIFALANTSEQYRPLAEWFSQKCPLKWVDGGSTNLDQIWNDAVMHKNTSNQHMITERSISLWAQQCNPERYKQINDQNYFIILSKYVFNYGGILEHSMVSDVLCAMLRSKFVVDIDPLDEKERSYWYEFVVPGQTACAGEMWKWRKESNPDELQKYISYNLDKVFQQVAESIDKNSRESDTEIKKKYYIGIGKKFATSRRKIFNDTFKSGVIRQAAPLFRRRGFAKSLDMQPNYIGVGNGVLELGNKCKLLDYYHEIPISKFTPYSYKPFDPNDPYVKLILDAFRDIIPERDMRNWTLFNAAQCLSGSVKEGILLLWYGSGANAKTFIMRLLAKVFGVYGTKLNISLFTSERESADRPNSAVMQLKGRRFGYVEETKKDEVLNDQRLKEIVNAGDISARDLNTKQDCFEVTANIMLGQNYDFIIKTRDHGTWRRIKHYTSKVQFRSNPNPDNPFDRKEDPRYLNEYVKDPNCLTAMLSILVYFYERLQTEYGGQLKNVKCETLERETEIFRNRQDTMNLFITELVVESPECEDSYSIDDVGNRYHSWLQARTRGTNMKRDELSEEVLNSALQKYIVRRENLPSIVKGIRILSHSSELLNESEKYIGLTKLDTKHIKIDDADDWYRSPILSEVISQQNNDTFLDEFKDDNFVKPKYDNKLAIDDDTNKYINKICEAHINIYNLYDDDYE
jgi:phage/plasmid-associated DNA primase